MEMKTVFRLIPLKKLLLFLLGLSMFIQLVIISYNHLSGYYQIVDLADFLDRWIYSVVLSFIGAILLAFPDLIVISAFNLRFDWSRKPFIRSIGQLVAVVIIAAIVSTAITVLSHTFNPFPEGLGKVLINNILIVAIINILLTIVLEAWIFFTRSDTAQKKAEELEKALSTVRYEVLKQQINPHFMFNSLNVLSGLVATDQKKAQEFIEEFSYIYRYVLETVEQPVVTFEREYNFVQSYMALQQIRYGSALQYHVDVPSNKLGKLMPPLSLQTVLENAIKHNIIEKESPLEIEITEERDILVVRNNYQSKMSKGVTTKIGLKNLTMRYSLVSEVQPGFYLQDGYFYANLPLIPSEDESMHN